MSRLRERAGDFGLSEAEYDRCAELLGREPNQLEAALVGAMWSEHCGYKNSRALFSAFPTQAPWVLVGPGENAGLVDIGEGYAVAFKIESHNHPSAVEPVQGAATGVGGILRDIFAMGARPFALLDSLRFGPLKGRSRALLEGVVEGIALYGNAVGVPTVGGEIGVHPCYQDNPLVNVMALGLLRRDQLARGTVGEAGNLVVYVGSRTGRDGLGGAVFASGDLSGDHLTDRPAVQVGDPFLGKLLMEATLAATEQGLVAGVQDMGAAGLTSSVSEMADRAGLGVDLDLDLVPTREEGLSPLELMLSESQERMILVVRPERKEELLELLRHWDLDAAVIGRVAEHRRFRLHFGGKLVCDLPSDLLANAPRYVQEAAESPDVQALRAEEVALPLPDDLAAAWLQLLADPNVASKRPVFERFDHQVMTNTVVLPGEGDAAVLRIRGTQLAIAATTDCVAPWVYLDPRAGAAAAVAEAARNLVCVGAEPLAVTDCLNFGNPYRQEVYYQLREAVLGIAEACRQLGTPVTGGNVSLYNQSGEQAIYPTPTIGMIGVIRDVRARATLSFKRLGQRVGLLGKAEGQLGGSLYARAVHGREFGAPPPLDWDLERRLQGCLLELIRSGSVRTAHDLSEGGLAVALSEMAAASQLGCRLELEGDGQRADALLFGESHGAALIAVDPGEAEAVQRSCRAWELPLRWLGEVEGSAIRIGTGSWQVNLPVETLQAQLEAPFREALG